MSLEKTWAGEVKTEERRKIANTMLPHFTNAQGCVMSSSWKSQYLGKFK